MKWSPVRTNPLPCTIWSDPPSLDPFFCKLEGRISGPQPHRNYLKFEVYTMLILSIEIYTYSVNQKRRPTSRSALLHHNY